MTTLSLEDLMRDIAVRLAQVSPVSDSTLIAGLMTADRYEREAVLNELERRAKAKEERK